MIDPDYFHAKDAAEKFARRLAGLPEESRELAFGRATDGLREQQERANMQAMLEAQRLEGLRRHAANVQNVSPGAYSSAFVSIGDGGLRPEFSLFGRFFPF